MKFPQIIINISVFVIITIKSFILGQTYTFDYFFKYEKPDQSNVLQYMIASERKDYVLCISKDNYHYKAIIFDFDKKLNHHFQLKDSLMNQQNNVVFQYDYSVKQLPIKDMYVTKSQLNNNEGQDNNLILDFTSPKKTNFIEKSIDLQLKKTDLVISNSHLPLLMHVSYNIQIDLPEKHLVQKMTSKIHGKEIIYELKNHQKINLKITLPDKLNITN